MICSTVCASTCAALPGLTTTTASSVFWKHIAEPTIGHNLVLLKTPRHRTEFFSGLLQLFSLVLPGAQNEYESVTFGEDERGIGTAPRDW
jgi:hypothetical protein